MKKTYSCILLFLGFLAACNSGKTSDTDQKLKTNTADHVLLKPFSDTVKTDTFKVVLKGDAPKNMVISFSITAHTGSKIYEKDFKASDLLKNYESTLDLNKESKQKDFILQEFNLFLEDENFLEPAVTENENPDANTPDKDFFNELKLSGLNGFKYRLSNESKVYIAWSAKAQKVLPYYSCCK